MTNTDKNKLIIPLLIIISILLFSLMALGIILIVKSRPAAFREVEITQARTEPTDAAANYPQSRERIVYSSSYDGFVVIREGPSVKSSNLGRFRNGPVGATFLSESGGWTQINYQGLVGWVNSRYISSMPTKEVTVDVDGDWLEGIWSDGDFGQRLIFNNGKYVEYWNGGSGGIEVGHYYLEGNEIICVIDRFDEDPQRIGDKSRSVIKKNLNLIGDYHRVKYVSQQTKDMTEGPDEILWTKNDFKRKKAEISRY